MNIYTKESLINKLNEITNLGFIPNARLGNHGGIGNTLEDLLGIEENNLPIPNAVEWELKTQRLNTSALNTLFHVEPSPRAIKFVPSILLPLYGWQHKEAGKKYPQTEMSFRQTIHGNSTSDRGFIVIIDRKNKRIEISFDVNKVSIKHREWLQTVKDRVGNLNELTPQPYWGFDDLEHKIGSKLHNCFFVQAAVKKIGGVEHYWYKKVQMLQTFSFQGFLNELERGNILVDFDARTGHNHGTKFRLRQNCYPYLYKTSKLVIDK
ncbi:MAG: MvaI/BcnI family restriction endonuclease [Chitinophagales bacterium]|nr:MvaI/BcnI restriction endonuclease family protein [Bacteroidota bacterium]